MHHSNYSQFSCSTAISRKVKTARDESVGSIKDIMVNTHSGEIDYVVLKIDEGFLNMGSKLLALPFESFEFNPHQDDIVIVKELKETLENAPGFDNDNWPTGPQAEFLHTMRSYYSQEERSLYGRYDHENKAYYNDEDRFDIGSDRIRDTKFGDGFLEPDHRGQRQSDIRRGGEPLL
ncbi:PRC-barrel domain protein [Algoriphagus ratkowskyi]|uniref:PRC-barrel domain containing protein n=1 Tax=Algoriphagus ratkowskyi TaxID=57028 RepID=A0A2W7SHR0_9BACT|nr:PRC-barrel domain-containing protein [Algoriphagus ratkowskyi]PZX50282.1 PRC-barrel domain protein [Algoriphagus ratkowskyi]TXD75632.1 PRC-barrel domain containing protein [Algoriphagus ratkowskyi]